MTQPLNIQTLEYVNPNPPVGVLLATADDALALWAWARNNPDFACRLSDRIDGSFEVQIEGVNTGTAKAVQGQWIVLDGRDFLALDPADWAAKYKLAGT